MNELIRITETNGKQAVSARELYEKLGYNSAHWAKWYRKNITGNPFAIENQDWQGFTLSVSGNETKDFTLSLDFAKKLSMLARTETGEQIRNYFVAMEKQAMGSMQQLEPEEILLRQMQMLVNQKKRLTSVENDVRVLQAQTMTRPNWFTIVGYATLHNMSIGLSVAGSLGKKAARLCKERNIQIESMPDPRFGRVHVYPENVLNEVFNQPLM